MKKITKVAVFGLVVFGLTACSESLSEEESSQGFAAMSMALSQGSAGAQSSPNSLVSVDYTFNCQQGGSATFTGNFDDQNASNNVTFDYQVSFNGCNFNGVTMDGDMNYAYDVTATATMTDLKYSYVGNVSFSGEVDGDCEMDFTGSVQTQTDGGTGSFNYKYSGTICGNDAGGALSGGGGGSYSY